MAENEAHSRSLVEVADNKLRNGAPNGGPRLGYFTIPPMREREKEVLALDTSIQYTRPIERSLGLQHCISPEK